MRKHLSCVRVFRDVEVALPRSLDIRKRSPHVGKGGNINVGEQSIDNRILFLMRCEIILGLGEVVRLYREEGVVKLLVVERHNVLSLQQCLINRVFGRVFRKRIG